MMDRLPARLAAIASRRAKIRRIQVAAELRAALPRDVSVEDEEDGVAVRGRRLGFRWLADPAFAVLRDLGGWVR